MTTDSSRKGPSDEAKRRALAQLNRELNSPAFREGARRILEMDDERPARFDQCDETCTVDCGHCKGQGVTR